jgi:hypothetical protein
MLSQLNAEKMAKMIQELLSAHARQALELAEAQSILEELSNNDNFGCLNRAAMRITVERRVAKTSGLLGLIAIDVAGMSTANSREGEPWVNHRIFSALEWLRENTRGSDSIIGQLNSGDEFLFLVDLGEVQGFLARVIEAFNRFNLNPDSGKDGAYVGWVEYDRTVPFTPPKGDIEGDCNTSRAMKKIYQLKAILAPWKEFGFSSNEELLNWVSVLYKDIVWEVKKDRKKVKEEDLLDLLDVRIRKENPKYTPEESQALVSIFKDGALGGPWKQFGVDRDSVDRVVFEIHSQLISERGKEYLVRDQMVDLANRLKDRYPTVLYRDCEKMVEAYQSK